MKRIFVCLLFVFLILPVIAFCEAEIAEAVAEVVVAELPTEPVSWDQLATISGAALATLLIVQLLKLPLDKVWKIPTRIVVFFIAFVILLLATYFTKGLNANNALLTVINSVIVALTAMGAYELTFHKLEEMQKRKEKEKE